MNIEFGNKTINEIKKVYSCELRDNQTQTQTCEVLFKFNFLKKELRYLPVFLHKFWQILEHIISIFYKIKN